MPIKSYSQEKMAEVAAMDAKAIEFVSSNERRLGLIDTVFETVMTTIFGKETWGRYERADDDDELFAFGAAAAVQGLLRPVHLQNMLDVGFSAEEILALDTAQARALVSFLTASEEERKSLPQNEEESVKYIADQLADIAKGNPHMDGEALEAEVLKAVKQPQRLAVILAAVEAATRKAVLDTMNMDDATPLSESQTTNAWYTTRFLGPLWIAATRYIGFQDTGDDVWRLTSAMSAQVRDFLGINEKSPAEHIADIRASLGKAGELPSGRPFGLVPPARPKFGVIKGDKE